MGSIGPSRGFLKSSFGVLSLLGFLWLLLIGVLNIASSTTAVTSRQGESLKPTLNTASSTTAATSRQGENLKSMGESMRGREKGVGVLNMSKRKVYNGPDPIHNRRAGNSRQPPGRA